PLTFRRMNKRSEFIGWWGVLVAFVISTYYSVIVAWAISYSLFSFTLSCGSDPTTFLTESYLQVVDAGQFGGFVPGILIALIIVWLLILGILFRGVKRGIEIVKRIMIPTLTIVFLIIVIRAVTLHGALSGLDASFQPDFSEIFNGN